MSGKQNRSQGFQTKPYGMEVGYKEAHIILFRNTNNTDMGLLNISLKPTDSKDTSIIIDNLQISLGFFAELKKLPRYKKIFFWCA